MDWNITCRIAFLHTATVSSLLQQMCPQTRVFVQSRLLLTDVLPYLSTILQPNFRPVNTQLYSAAEKAQLFDVINTMLAFNLTYSQERSKEGQYQFTMEPNIEELVRFDNSGTSRSLGYTARQLVAREVEMERVRRSEMYFSQQEQEKKKNPNRGLFQSAAYKAKKAQSASGKCSLSASNVEVNQPKTVATNSTEDSGEVISSQGSNEDANVPNHLRKLVAKPLIKNTKINVSVYTTFSFMNTRACLMSVVFVDSVCVSYSVTFISILYKCLTVLYFTDSSRLLWSYYPTTSASRRNL